MEFIPRKNVPHTSQDYNTNATGTYFTWTPWLHAEIRKQKKPWKHREKYKLQLIYYYKFKLTNETFFFNLIFYTNCRCKDKAKVKYCVGSILFHENKVVY